jgi:hypothetical protein
MKNNIKTFLHIFGLFLFIIFLFILFILFNKNIIEGYQSTYQNLNYSQSVDLPIVFPFSCKNFCGPNNTCAITGEQCTADYDCTGCQLKNNINLPVEPYYRELDKNFNQMDSIFIGSKNNLPISQYSGNQNDLWKKAFDIGIKLYNRKEEYNNPLSDFEKKILVSYPTSISATGQFYQSTAPAYGE